MERKLFCIAYQAKNYHCIRHRPSFLLYEIGAATLAIIMPEVLDDVVRIVVPIHEDNLGKDDELEKCLQNKIILQRKSITGLYADYTWDGHKSCMEILCAGLDGKGNEKKPNRPLGDQKLFVNVAISGYKDGKWTDILFSLKKSELYIVQAGDHRSGIRFPFKSPLPSMQIKEFYSTYKLSTEQKMTIPDQGIISKKDFHSLELAYNDELIKELAVRTTMDTVDKETEPAPAHVDEKDSFDSSRDGTPAPEHWQNWQVDSFDTTPEKDENSKSEKWKAWHMTPIVLPSDCSFTSANSTTNRVSPTDQPEIDHDRTIEVQRPVTSTPIKTKGDAPPRFSFDLGNLRSVDENLEQENLSMSKGQPVEKTQLPVAITKDKEDDIQKELIGTDARKIFNIPIIQMAPALIIRAIDEDRIDRMKRDFLNSPKDRQGLTPGEQIFSGITNNDQSKILVIDGQHRLALYKQLIQENKMDKETSVDISLVFVDNSSLEAALVSVESNKLSTTTDPVFLKASLTIMRECVIQKKYSEADLLRVIRYTLRNNDSLPNETRLEIYNSQGLLANFLRNEFGIERSPSVDMAAALILSEDTFEKGLEMSDRLVEKGKQMGISPATLYGYKLWQSIHLRDNEKYKNQLRQLMDEFIDQPLEVLNLASWKHKLHTELPTARGAKRGPRQLDGSDVPRIGDGPSKPEENEKENQNPDETLKDFQQNIEKIMQKHTDNFINKVQEAMSAGDPVLVLIQENDDLSHIYPAISNSSCILFIRGGAHYRYLIENHDLQGKTIAQVSTPGQGPKNSAYESVSRHCILAANYPRNSWIAEMNGRHYPSKTTLSQSIRSQLGQNHSIVRNVPGSNDIA